jgi:RNA recognition motif-containing protein
MSKRIYVGGLPYSAQDSELQSLFATHGEVSEVSIVTDRYTGQARGFAFVNMANDDEASAAIKALDGTQMGGRTLIVNEARERESGGGGRSGGGGGRSGGGGRW